MLRLGIDLVHGRNWPGVDALLAGALIPGVALVFSEHGFEHMQPSGLPENRPLRQRATLRLLGERLTCVYASAPDVADRLAAHIGWPRESVPVMVGGVDTVSYHPAEQRRNQHDGAFRIGAAANLRPVKRPDLILDMVGQLVRSRDTRGFQVEVAGEGPLLSSVRGTVKGFGWDELVLLPGRVGDMPDWYRSLDAVVVSSDYEACSNVILEAMASALPVAATDVGLTRTLLGECSAGIVVPRGDGKALARAVLALMNSPECAARMGRVGRERAVTCYSLARSHMAFAEMYRQAFEIANRSPTFRAKRTSTSC
jgi:glycosyltransferase involved in cell wall biosynthesis